MAYTINKTDGTVLTTIVDATLDETTNLGLPGKGYNNYGEIQNENYVKLLENFAEVTADAPSKPLLGQLFYDRTLDQMQVYDGTQFKAVAGTIISSTEPTFGAQGDLWFSTGTTQVYVYTGSIWQLVGPQGALATGAVADTIIDTTGTAQDVVKLLVDNNLVGIVSDLEFTPQTTLAGYTTVKKGITLGTNITDNKFQGTATDTDALGGIAAANYLRSNVADTMTGTLTISNDASLILGADNDIVFSQAGADFTMSNTSSDGDIIIRVNDGGVTTTAMTIDGATSSVDIANNLTVDGTTTTVTMSATTSVASPTIITNIIQSDDSSEVIVDDGLIVKGNVTATNLIGNITTSSSSVVDSNILKSSVQLIIYDSSGSAVKTLFGAGA
tara:strand:+ start:72 stop:1229 length:1158 start_codon:yes stop_codon:yes gene_type:complete